MFCLQMFVSSINLKEETTPFAESKSTGVNNFTKPSNNSCQSKMPHACMHGLSVHPYARTSKQSAAAL
jgi:hypothetical protein